MISKNHEVLYAALCNQQLRGDEMKNSELSFFALFSSVSEPVFLVDREGIILDANSAFCSRFRLSEPECRGKNFYGLLSPEEAKLRMAVMQEVLRSRTTLTWDDEWEEQLRRYSVYPSQSAHGAIDQLLIIAQDFTDMGHLVKNERLFSRSVIEAIPGSFYVLDAGGKLSACNRYVRDQIFDTAESDITDIIGIECIHPDDRAMMAEKVERIMKNGEELITEVRVLLHGGPEYRRFLMTGSRMVIDSNPFLVGVGIDISERKKVEEDLLQSKERLDQVISQMDDVVWSASVDGSCLLDVNNALEKIYGISIKEFYAKPELWIQMVHPEDREIAKASNEELHKNGRAESEYRIVKPDGAIRWIFDRKSISVDNNHVPVSINGIGFDITNRKLAEDKLHRQLQRLHVLREIDFAIRGTTDIYLALKTVLEGTISELQVDAADIFLLDPHTNTLRFMVGRGFRSTEIERQEIKLSDGDEARLLEQKYFDITNLAETESCFISLSLTAQESFVRYYSIPLIVKGNFSGLFEVFQRKPLLTNPDLLDFLHTLAGQAAMAIEDYQSVRKLRGANQELLRAYDSTIEGWARALDLRDEETEGHSRRVTEMTLKLACAAEIPDEAMADIRRGALLHDIGKMALPDTILFKVDQLTKDEWALMRTHPALAYTLLSPIAYLHCALDIPYCHHEKWDGSGYPRGLKGKEIPLAARLFAVVDVWDALQSDRPYRQGLPKVEVIEHIKLLSGTHFDPEIVTLFLKMITTGELP